MEVLLETPTDWETASNALPYIGYDVPEISPIKPQEVVRAFGIELKEFDLKVLIIWNQTRNRIQIMTCGRCNHNDVKKIQDKILEIAEMATRKLMPGTPALAEGVFRGTPIEVEIETDNGTAVA